MHELSIAQNIVATVVATARQHGIRRITKVHVAIGPLSGVIEDSLQFCFPIALQDSGFKNIELCIEKKALGIQCQKCQAETELTEIILQCPRCGSQEVSVTSGRDLIIKSMEGE